jgi:hypothetical protein
MKGMRLQRTDGQEEMMETPGMQQRNKGLKQETEAMSGKQGDIM